MLKCQGIDETPVEDDNGGLPKTVSVENSFRRGTVTTRDAVIHAMNDVCKRLPHLLKERSLISNNPLLAYPTTLRLTVRLVIFPNDSSKKPPRSQRRPFETFSKQSTFQGKKLMGMDDSEKPEFLFKTMASILHVLVLEKPSFDVTRLNLAATNFCDIDAGTGIVNPSPSKQTVMTQSFNFSQTQSTQNEPISSLQCFNSIESRSSQIDEIKPISQNHHFTKTRPSQDEPESAVHSATKVTKLRPEAKPQGYNLRACDIDQSVLDELPADIRAQILQQFPKASKKRSRIDDFFKPFKAKK